MAIPGLGTVLSLLKINIAKNWRSYRITNLGAPTSDTDAARRTDIQNPTFDINMSSHKITNLGAPTDDNDAARLSDIPNPASMYAVEHDEVISITHETPTHTESVT